MNTDKRTAAMNAYINDTLRKHHLCGTIILSEKVQSLSHQKRTLNLSAGTKASTLETLQKAGTTLALLKLMVNIITL